MRRRSPRRTRSWRHRIGIAGALLVTAAALSSCSSNGDTTTGPSGPGDITFYTSPISLDHGDAGDLVGQEPIALDGLNGNGRRVTYASTTPNDDIVHLTGVIITPAGVPDAAVHPVAVWGHPTEGIGMRCAPSLTEPFSLEGAQPLLDAGYIVAAPDYDGLGSGGIHPYLVGDSEARAILDIARAAGDVGGNGITVVWGHSQGAHAALWARSLADTYAPDLDLRGVAAAAPPTDLAAFLDPGFTNAFIMPVTLQTVLSWSVVYEGAELRPLVIDTAFAAGSTQISTCTENMAAATANLQPDQVWALGPDDVAAWHELTSWNSVDAGRGSAPVFLSHGGDDNLVPIAGTRALRDALCAGGENVQFRTAADWTHASSYTEARPEMISWLIAAGNGDPPPSQC